MFNKTSVPCDRQIEEAVRKAVNDNNHKHELELARLNSDHEIALKEKDFELKHLETEKMTELTARVVSLEKELAVEKKTNEMLVKITDLNADVVDVKELVTKLIEKLPEVKINSLTTTCGGKQG